MPSLKNFIVLITGASSGIGAASARAFAAEGAHLILAARRADRIQAAAEQLHAEFGVDVLPLTLDVRDQAQVAQVLGNLSARWAAIDILVNNAGLSRGLEKVHEGLISDWDEMLDTNVKGLLYVTRTVLPGMVARGRGHVINTGSIAGHEPYPGGNVYCASKAAVGMLTKTLRMDLLGTGIRVTCVEPAMTETEFSLVRYHGDKTRADKTYQGFQPLTAADIADAILWAATRPAHVNVENIVIFPTAQASATMAHRT
jgi:3-hydroxy acid dehydrogenase / malonic semialdehyde reductase